MKIISLRLRDFRSYADAEIAFSDGQNYIFGGNWQGKSSIVDGIGFAIFGRQAFPSRLSGSVVKTEHLVRDDADSGSVELVFSHRGREYRIHRTCPRDHPQLFCDNKQIAAGVTPVREALVELLGIDPALFAAIFSSPQDDLRRVLDLAPEERRLFIESLIGFEHIKRIQSRAKRCRATLTAWIEGYIRSDMGSAAAQAKRIETRIRACTEAIDALDIEIDTTTADATLSDPVCRLKAAEEYATCAGEQSAFQRLIDGVRGGSCPVCSQSVPAHEQSRVAARLAEHIATLERRCRALQPFLVDARKDVKRSEDLSRIRAERDAKVRELDFYRGELRRIGHEIEAYNRRGDVVASIENECAFLKELDDTLDEFRKEARMQIAQDLEDAVNIFLERFSDGDFDARLAITEDFGFNIMLHDRKVPLFNLSGAARDLLAISLRYGLYRIAAREIDFLLLDEPTRHLDPSNIQRLKRAFDGIGDHQLIVITVNDEFEDALGTKYVVGKDERRISEIRPLEATERVKKTASSNRTGTTSAS